MSFVGRGVRAWVWQVVPFRSEDGVHRGSKDEEIYSGSKERIMSLVYAHDPKTYVATFQAFVRIDVDA